MLSASDYGPFGPVVGYGGAIIATGGAIFALWGGRMKKWRPPDEDLPGGAQAIVLLLCGVGMVLQWYLATPSVLKWFIASIPLLLMLCVVCFVRYSDLLGTYRYVKIVATSATSTREVPILGGVTCARRLRQNGKNTTMISKPCLQEPPITLTSCGIDHRASG